MNVYKHGLKIFNLYKHLPLAAMTCGIGNFGSRSISNLAKEFRYTLTQAAAGQGINAKNYTVEEVVDRAKVFLFDQCFAQLNPLPRDRFEFWIAGYPSDMNASFEVWKLIFQNGVCEPPTRVANPGSSGLYWGGMVSPVTRLLLGFDESLEAALARIIGLDLNNPQPAKVAQVTAIRDVVRSYSEVFLHSPIMPIQDAIDLASFLAHTARDYYRFLPGADIVGGDIDVATITRHEGFKWIRRKQFYPPSLNPLETDHA
jgi:hypothetical protein